MRFGGRLARVVLASTATTSVSLISALHTPVYCPITQALATALHRNYQRPRVNMAISLVPITIPSQTTSHPLQQASSLSPKREREDCQDYTGENPEAKRLRAINTGTQFPSVVIRRGPAVLPNHAISSPPLVGQTIPVALNSYVELRAYPQPIPPAMPGMNFSDFSMFAFPLIVPATQVYLSHGRDLRKIRAPHWVRVSKVSLQHHVDRVPELKMKKIRSCSTSWVSEHAERQPNGRSG